MQSTSASVIIGAHRGHRVYLRHTTIAKSGKRHTYWRLVKSVRTGSRVRQVTVAHLGELDADGRLAAQALAEQIIGVERLPGLFDDEVPSEPIPLKLGELRLERSRFFGDVWLAHKLWQAVGLDELLQRLMPPGREQVSWATMAAVLVIARCCEPSSELHIAEDWFRRTALDDLLGIPDEKVNDDRCYRALDKLLEHKATLETHLKSRLGTLFGLDYDLLLYDVTSTYFEGLAEKNPLAQRGYSRDHRGDCKQVCIGLVVTREGFPLGFEVFAGNGAQLTWQRRDDVWQQHEHRDGCYVLRSNVTDWTAEELWTAYTQLTEAEAAFRMQKDQLKLRPVWHQKAERVTAHILVCFLAYVLRKTLEGWSNRAGLGLSLPTLLEEMRLITSTDVVVPTADGREVRMRCVVRPDTAQSILLTRLGMRVPQRLKLPQGVRAKARL